jgi:hypothetical protein
MSSHGTFSAENPAVLAATALQVPSIAGRSPDAHFKFRVLQLCELTSYNFTTGESQTSCILAAQLPSTAFTFRSEMLVFKHQQSLDKTP